MSKNENLEISRKRLLYQSWHRGCKETDNLLGEFAKAHINELDDEELLAYEKFIAEDDWDIYAWLVGKVEFPTEHINSATDKIRKFNYADSVNNKE